MIVSSQRDRRGDGEMTDLEKWQYGIEATIAALVRGRKNPFLDVESDGKLDVEA
jgi:hypothetical protein